MKKVILILLLCIPTLALSQLNVMSKTWTAKYGKEITGSVSGGEKEALMALKLNGNKFIIYGGYSKSMIGSGIIDRECDFKKDRNIYGFTVLNFNGDNEVGGQILLNYPKGYAEIEFYDKSGERIIITLFDPEFIVKN